MNELLWRLIARVVSQPRVADWLIRRAQSNPYRPIPADASYMWRGWVFNEYKDTIETEHEHHEKAIPFLPSIRVHHIKRPDRDRAKHDHPCNARTCILKNWYNEERLLQCHENYPPADIQYIRKVGDTASLKFGEYHRITAVHPDGVWTLFFTWKYQGVWGFLVDGVKIPWRDYLKSIDGF